MILELSINKKQHIYNFNIAIHPPPLPTMQKGKDKRWMERFGKEKKHSKGEREEENVIFSRVLEHSFQKLEGRESIYIKGKLMVGKG